MFLRKEHQDSWAQLEITSILSVNGGKNFFWLLVLRQFASSAALENSIMECVHQIEGKARSNMVKITT